MALRSTTCPRRSGPGSGCDRGRSQAIGQLAGRVREIRPLWKLPVPRFRWDAAILGGEQSLMYAPKKGAAGGGSRPLGAWVMEGSGTEAVFSLESNAIVPLASERVDRTPVQFVLEPRYYPAEEPQFSYA